MTYLEWMRRGEGTDNNRATADNYAKFAKDVRFARANARISAEIKIKAMDPKWWVARMYRKDWGDNPTQVEVTGKEGAPLSLTLEMVRQFLDATEEKMRSATYDDVGAEEVGE